MRGLIVVFGGLPSGVWAGWPGEGVNDYAQLWFGVGMGFSGCIGVYTQRQLVANFSYLFGYSSALRT